MNAFEQSLPRSFSAFAASHPMLTCEESVQWEAKLLPDDEAAWRAMRQAGAAAADAVRNLYKFSNYDQRRLSAFALVGKGHNGGDALLALANLAERGRLERALLAMPSGEAALRPLVARSLALLRETAGQAAEISEPGEAGYDAWIEGLERAFGERRFDVCLDGLLGMQFSPPLREDARKLLAAVNANETFRLRLAVDLPSGVGDRSDQGAFRADATLATGIAKATLADPETAEFAGAFRYGDIGFFEDNSSCPLRVITDRILDPLRGLRPFASDKRGYGHLLVLAGSRSMPGALAMAVQAAVSSGAGLATVLAPASAAAGLAPRLPEAMWTPFPETPEGGLALEGEHLLRAAAGRATALLVGPGMGREPETLALVESVVRGWDKPLLIDADALQPRVLEALRSGRPGRAILTPHVGEYARLARREAAETPSIDELRRFARSAGQIILLKGPNTRIASEGRVFVNASGNPVLARGGSGDLLSGLTAGLLAQMPGRPLEAACMGAHWHGKAADVAAMRRGQGALRTIQLLDGLAEALREGEAWRWG